MGVGKAEESWVGCGVVWCGVVWCGVVWCGVVRGGVVWGGVVRCRVLLCGGVVWGGAARGVVGVERKAAVEVGGCGGEGRNGCVHHCSADCPAQSQHGGVLCVLPREVLVCCRRRGLFPICPAVQPTWRQTPAHVCGRGLMPSGAHAHVVMAPQVDTEVWIRLFYEDKSLPTALWHIEKFWNRVYLMRELYQVRCGVGQCGPTAPLNKQYRFESPMRRAPPPHSWTLRRPPLPYPMHISSYPRPPQLWGLTGLRRCALGCCDTPAVCGVRVRPLHPVR